MMVRLDQLAGLKSHNGRKFGTLLQESSRHQEFITSGRVCGFKNQPQQHQRKGYAEKALQHHVRDHVDEHKRRHKKLNFHNEIPGFWESRVREDRYLGFGVNQRFGSNHDQLRAQRNKAVDVEVVIPGPSIDVSCVVKDEPVHHCTSIAPDDRLLLKKCTSCDDLFNLALDHDPWEDNNIDWNCPPLFDVYADEGDGNNLLHNDFPLKEEVDIDRIYMGAGSSSFYGLFGHHIQHHDDFCTSALEIKSFYPCERDVHGVFLANQISITRLIGETLMIAVPSTAYLPNLKTLELGWVRYQNEESVTNLICCSLGLENLSIWVNSPKNMPYMHVPKLRIHAPAMKSLQIVKGSHSRASADNGLDKNALAVSEHTEDHVSDSLQITNTGSLNKAKLDLHKTLSYQWLIKCFEAFCIVYCLSFSGDIPASLNFESGLPLVMFLRLTKNRSCSGRIHAEELWNDPVLVPRCLMTCLITIWIQDFRESEFELGMLKYVLKNGNVLQKLEIGLADTHRPWNTSTRGGGTARKFELKYLRSVGNYRQLEAKYSIAKKIKNIQKGSDACEIDIL
ncbi:OLC1v1005770C1 [Oldenlandia corymbosa var. corymbosa]|uniref:OLC1v1005770C1 n=1 Tax=Oldenlandia corymbosa var. corymbosa TaxID=529605 RepID=A0AAV1DFB7_OLDCO|nr:OLC1v1005770C1 [Oldenlandia corymbosa var. corymbosa]